MPTIADINEKIRQGKATAWTITEAKARIEEMGISAAAKAVDVVTTGAFEPMEGSGAMLNLGHTDPPIKIVECHLDGVLAYAGFGAVDLYIGAGQMASPNRDGSRDGDAEDHGGGHVIADLIADKPVSLTAIPLPKLHRGRQRRRSAALYLHGASTAQPRQRCLCQHGRAVSVFERSRLADCRHRHPNIAWRW